MTPAPPITSRDFPSPGKRMLSLGLVLFALLATAPGYRNAFTQDDLPLILKNETIHSLKHPDAFFTTPYWHDPFPPALYRPLATAGLALQWSAGGGSPAVYRWVSAALLAGAALALFELALLVLPVWPAWIAAALFAVHPVHVEATALGVNQGELAVALLVALATACYIRERRQGGLGRAAAGKVLVLLAGAALFKENGLMLPGILIAAELTVVGDPRPLRERAAQLRPFYLGLGLTIAVILAARSAVLHGDLVGTFTADAMAGVPFGGRALTMLGVVPQWARLLLWPAQLQADYGPDEIVRATGWGAAQWAGLLLVLFAVAALVASWRRFTPLAFGLAWITVALLPVTNVLVPTGVVLAERTLLLPSAGVTLSVGALLWLAWSTAPARLRGAVLGGSALGLALLLGLGLLRSRSRDRVWLDQGTLLRHTVVDAPKSFNAHLALTRFLEDSGDLAAAAGQYRTAIGIRPAVLGRDRALADQYRLAGLCRPAVRLYRRLLTIAPGDADLAASLDGCLRNLELHPTVPSPR